MPAAFVGNGSQVTAQSSTTATPTFHANRAAGHRHYLYGVHKRVSNVLSLTANATGWTKVVDVTVGTGADGVDAGQLRISIWEADDPNGTLLAPTIGITGSPTTADGFLAVISTWSKSASEDWDCASLGSGSDTASDTNFTISYAATLVRNGDYHLAVMAYTSDTPTNSSRNISTVPVTASTGYTNTVDTAVTNGNDFRVVAGYRKAQGGSASAVPTSAMILSAASTGGAVLYRVRATKKNGFVARDRFNRADGALGSNWLSTATPVHNIGSNQILAPAGTTIARWAEECKPGPIFSQIKWLLSVTRGPTICIGIHNEAQAQSASAANYQMRINASSTILVKHTEWATTYSSTLATASLVPAAGDIFRLEFDGVNKIRGYRNGVLLWTYTDPSPIIGQYGVGFGANATTDAGSAVFDDWIGGNYMESNSVHLGAGDLGVAKVLGKHIGSGDFSSAFLLGVHDGSGGMLLP